MRSLTRAAYASRASAVPIPRCASHALHLERASTCDQPGRGRADAVGSAGVAEVRGLRGRGGAGPAEAV
eukprot:1464730-Prymnesium_polylepis.1